MYVFDLLLRSGFAFEIPFSVRHAQVENEQPVERRSSNINEFKSPVSTSWSCLEIRMQDEFTVFE